jgi:N utilization substance protein B
MSRRTARKHIMRILFQTDFHKDETLDSLITTYCLETEQIPEADLVFVRSQLEGILSKETELVEAINSSSKDWTVERMSKLDAAILKLAFYEIMFCEDIPDRVSINEAVELAKEFSSDEAPAFINGILGGFIRSRA